MRLTFVLNLSSDVKPPSSQTSTCKQEFLILYPLSQNFRIVFSKSEAVVYNVATGIMMRCIYVEML